MGQLLRETHTSVAVIPSSTNEIDSDGILERVGGDRELLAELVEMFKKEAPRALFDIRSSVEKGERPASNAPRTSCGARWSRLAREAAAAATLALEGLGRNGALTGASVHVGNLEHELERLTSELDRLIEVKPV